MPQLNLSPALSSLLMQDTVNVYRREENVNGFGEVRTSERVFSNLSCVVFPGGQNKLDRRPESQSTEKTIEVVIRFGLNMAADGQQPDVVEWAGDRYTVVSALDYSRYGAGFTHAVAVIRKMVQGQAPQVREGVA